MRTLLMTVLTLCGFALPLSPASADDPIKKPAVRELDVKERQLKLSGSVEKPVVVTSIQGLSTCSGICFKESLLYRLAEQVDFKNEVLLYFAWSGSAQDKLTFKIENCPKRREHVTAVNFQYQRGATADARSHFRLIVVPKDAAWSVTNEMNKTP